MSRTMRLFAPRHYPPADRRVYPSSALAEKTRWTGHRPMTRRGSPRAETAEAGQAEPAPQASGPRRGADLARHRTSPLHTRTPPTPHWVSWLAIPGWRRGRHRGGR